jgi:predicted RNase H-like HicB family nuclease
VSDTLTLGSSKYAVDATSRDGLYLVKYSCAACKWQGCTPHRKTPTDAMDAALDDIEKHHAECHKVSDGRASRA